MFSWTARSTKFTTTNFAYSKDVMISAGGTVRVSKSIRTDASNGAGGRITIEASGDITAPGKLSAQGGGLAGSIYLESSTGSVAIDGRASVSAKGGSYPVPGQIHVSAAVDVTVSGDLLLRGAEPGRLAIAAGDVVRIATGAVVDLRSSKSCGALLTIDAGGDLVQEVASRIVGCASPALTAGGDATLGWMDLESRVLQRAAGSLTAAAGGDLRVSGAIVGRPASDSAQGTAVSLSGCNLFVDGASSIEARSNVLRAASSMLVVTGIVTPTPTISFNGALACGP